MSLSLGTKFLALLISGRKPVGIKQPRFIHPRNLLPFLSLPVFPALSFPLPTFSPDISSSRGGGTRTRSHGESNEGITTVFACFAEAWRRRASRSRSGASGWKARPSSSSSASWKHLIYIYGGRIVSAPLRSFIHPSLLEKEVVICGVVWMALSGRCPHHCLLQEVALDAGRMVLMARPRYPRWRSS